MRSGWQCKKHLSAAALTLAVATSITACGTSSKAAATSSRNSGGTGSTSATTATKSPYTIHAILSLTGAGSALGKEEKAALTALAVQTNRNGGIDGHPIKFAITDDQTVPSVGVSEAAPLISAGVPALIDGSLTSVDQAINALASPKSGPVIFDTSPGDHPAKGSFVFASGEPTREDFQAFAHFAASKGWSRIGVLTSDDTTGADGWKSLQTGFKDANSNVTVVDHEVFAPNAVSVSTQLAHLKAAHPQVMVVWTTGTPLETVLKGMKDSGMSMPVYTTAGNASPPLLARLKSLLPANLYFVSRAWAVPAQLNGRVKTIVTSYEQAMANAGDSHPGNGEALAWDPGAILISALQKLGVNATSAAIRNYVANITNFVGVSGTYNFKDATVNQGVGINSIYVVKWDPTTKAFIGASGPAGVGSA